MARFGRLELAAREFGAGTGGSLACWVWVAQWNSDSYRLRLCRTANRGDTQY